MAYQIRTCKAIASNKAKDNTIFLFNDGGGNEAYYVRYGYQDSTYSTSNGTVEWSHSCAKSNWASNNRTYTITMDNALRNAINSKINSGGLVNIQNYVTQINEFKATDMHNSNAIQVFGYICANSSKTGSFDATQFGYWEGDWPKKFPTSIQYNYDIPGVGTMSDTIMVLSNGWYTRGSNRMVIWYSKTAGLWSQHTIDQICNPPQGNDWIRIEDNFYVPFSANGVQRFLSGFKYYTINGVFSRNAGTRNCYSDNAADILLNSGSNYFYEVTNNVLMSNFNAGAGACYPGSPNSITNNIIMAITNINFVNNTITVKFAVTHDRNHSMIAFLDGQRRSFAAMRLNYNFPVTSVTRPVDNWRIAFISKSDFNPDLPNGTNASSVIWDSSNNAITLSAGPYVNNSNGFAKIISREQGVLQCSCANVNNSIRVTIGGYSITIPSSVNTFDIRIISLNNGQLGYWRITPPGIGLSHTFTITYPATENAPLVSFNNELYTAITQALNEPGLPFEFSILNVNNEYQISVSGMVRCDVVQKDSKRYHTLSIYDVNGDFSQLLVKNGTYATLPVTLTADLQVVNNTILVKAGMSSIGYTSTTIGDIPINTDAVAVLLPAVASVSKNGSRIGYATTTVNQSSFAFSFSALKTEVEETDDFVSHYLQKV